MFFRFKKQRKEKFLTNTYWEKYALDQDDDNISVHRGVMDSISSKDGSKQGSIMSRLSGKKKPQSQDHTSLLENGENSEEDTDDMNSYL